jgi:DegV family protein with EDD domain
MIKIIADTLSCISPQEAKHLDIPFLPQIIIFGEDSYRDDYEINPTSFLQKLKEVKEFPKTAAPSPAMYSPIFEQLIKQGYQPLVVCPSSELSGTYRGALVAAKDFISQDIRVVDTRTLGAGLGVLVKKAIQWAADGDDANTIEKKITAMASRERIYFIVESLDHLYRGGRIGGARALVGSVLQMKPILKLQDGGITPAENQRTKKRALLRILELVDQECPKDQTSHASVMHGGAEEDAKNLAKEVARITGNEQVPIFEIPPAILVHGGPGALAVSFFRAA